MEVDAKDTQQATSRSTRQIDLLNATDAVCLVFFSPVVWRSCTDIEIILSARNFKQSVDIASPEYRVRQSR